MRTTHPFALLLISIVVLGCGQAPQLPNSAPQNLPRLPGDNIEGSIWEYTGTPKSEVGKTDVPSKTISGRFRIEGNAVFDVRLVGVLPSRDKVKRVAEKLKRGEGMEL